MVSTPLMALAIWSGVASDFHSTLITWTTVLGFIGAPRRKAAAKISTGQTAKIVLFVMMDCSFRQDSSLSYGYFGKWRGNPGRAATLLYSCRSAIDGCTFVALRAGR